MKNLFIKCKNKIATATGLLITGFLLVAIGAIFFPESASADTTSSLPVYTLHNGYFNYLTDPTGGENDSCVTDLWQATFPVESNNRAGGSTGGIPFVTCFNNFSSLNNGNLISYGNTYGDGNYWQEIKFGDVHYYVELNRTNGIWTAFDNETGGIFLSVNSPVPSGLTTSDDLVLFDFDWFNDDTWAYSGVSILNLSSQQQLVLEQPALSSGVNTFSLSYDFTYGDSVSWRPFVRTSTSSQVIYGDTYTFYVEVAPSSTPAFSTSSLALGYDLADSVCQDITGSSSGFGYEICHAVAFVFVPSQNSLNQYSTLLTTIQGKFPFAYFYEINTALQNVQSSALYFDSSSLDFQATALPFSVVVFSSSTISHFVPDSLAGILRGLLQFALWSFLAWSIYASVMSLFNPKQ